MNFVVAVVHSDGMDAVEKYQRGFEMPEQLSVGDFSPHLHTRFVVAHLENYELELTEVTDHSNAKLEQFSLIFIGVLSPWLPQGVYRLIHARIGEHELFLVPLGPDPAGMRYEASFSRLTSQPDAADDSVAVTAP